MFCLSSLESSINNLTMKSLKSACFFTKINIFSKIFLFLFKYFVSEPLFVINEFAAFKKYPMLVTLYYS